VAAYASAPIGIFYDPTFDSCSVHGRRMLIGRGSIASLGVAHALNILSGTLVQVERHASEYAKRLHPLSRQGFLGIPVRSRWILVDGQVCRYTRPLLGNLLETNVQKCLLRLRGRMKHCPQNLPSLSRRFFIPKEWSVEARA
jgi:hypothetical protein